MEEKKADTTADSVTVCTGCGKEATGKPVTWVCSVENGERRYFCDACSRVNIRAIEGRLDSSWW